MHILIVTFFSFFILNAQAVELDGDNRISDELFKSTIKDFFQHNASMKSLINYMRTVFADNWITCLKNIYFAGGKVYIRDQQNDSKYMNKCDPNWPCFSENRWGMKTMLIFDKTFLDISQIKHKIQEAKHASQDIEEAEKLTFNFIKTIVDLNLKLEFAKDLQTHIAKCLELKGKKDLSIEEKANFEAKLLEFQAAFENLKNDIEDLEQSIALYWDANENDLENINALPKFDLSLNDLTSLNTFKDFDIGSVTLKKSEYSLKKAKFNIFKECAGPFMLTVTIDRYFDNAWLNNQRKYWHKSNNPYIEQGNDFGIIFDFGIDFSPKAFFEIYKAQHNYEYAKNKYIWAKRNYDFEKAKANTKINLVEKSINNAKKLLKNKKLALKEVSSSDSSSYKKIADALINYHDALNNYYKVAHQCVDAILEEMKLTGKLRIVFIDIIDEEMKK